MTEEKPNIQVKCNVCDYPAELLRISVERWCWKCRFCKLYGYFNLEEGLIPAFSQSVWSLPRKYDESNCMDCCIWDWNIFNDFLVIFVLFFLRIFIDTTTMESNESIAGSKGVNWHYFSRKVVKMTMFLLVILLVLILSVQWCLP